MRKYKAISQQEFDASQYAVVIGDTHGHLDAIYRAARLAKTVGTRILLHVGDLGIGPWPSDRKSWCLGLERHLSEVGMWLIVTPGNHDNYDTIDASPRDEEGMIVLGERIRALPRGHRWTMRGVRFGSLGGAVSVDQFMRTEGRTWWPQEEPTEADLDALGTEPLDVLITHDVPAAVQVASTMHVTPGLAMKSDAVRSLLDEAVTRTKPQVVFSGHWHQRTTQEINHYRGQEIRTVRYEVLPHEIYAENSVLLDLENLSVRAAQTQRYEWG